MVGRGRSIPAWTQTRPAAGFAVAVVVVRTTRRDRPRSEKCTQQPADRVGHRSHEARPTCAVRNSLGRQRQRSPRSTPRAVPGVSAEAVGRRIASDWPASIRHSSAQKEPPRLQLPKTISTRRSLAQPASSTPDASSSPREVVAMLPAVIPASTTADFTLSARR